MPEKSENKAAAEKKSGSGYVWRIFSLVLLVGWILALCFYHPDWFVSYGWLFGLLFVPLAFFAFFLFSIIKNGFGLAIVRIGEFRTMKMRQPGFKFLSLSDLSDLQREKETQEGVQAAAEAEEEEIKLEPEQWDIVSDPERKGHTFGGLVFVGVFFMSKVYKYTLSWKTISSNGVIKPHEKEELDRFLLLPKAYYFEVEKAEDRNQMPLKINGQVTVQMENPYRALFLFDDYLTAAQNDIKAKIVGVVRELSFYKEVESQKKEVEEQLEEKPEEKTTTTFNIVAEKDKIISAIKEKVETEKFVKELRKVYGLRLQSLTISNIDPESDVDREATLKPIRARLEAEAVKEKAVGEADAVKEKAKGDADKIVTLAEANRKATGLEIGGAHSEISQALRRENVSEDKIVDMANEYMKLKMETETNALKHIKIDAPEGGGGLAGTAAIFAELFKGISGGQQAQQNKTFSEEKGGGIIIPKESAASSQVPPGVPIVAGGILKPGQKTPEEIRAEEIRIMKEEDREKANKKKKK